MKVVVGAFDDREVMKNEGELVKVGRKGRKRRGKN